MLERDCQHSRKLKNPSIDQVGTSGTKNAAIREHLKSVAGQYRDLDPTIDQFPADGAPFDAEHYKAAIDAMKPGDAVTVFTPDETHFDISLYAIRKGLHVLVAKPAVMTTQEHAQLIKEAAERKVLVMVENHKRWDPIYSDARGKIRTYGDMGFFQAFMSQPKTQLETFSKWLGKGSDISYYLNSHHVDFLCWAMQGLAVPITATAMGSTGVAKVTEDTITVMVQFKNLASGNLGTAIFTSSWVAAKKAEVHSQQRFSYMGHTGEMRVDQAHRGYEIATDDAGYASVNPLYSESLRSDSPQTRFVSDCSSQFDHPVLFSPTSALHSRWQRLLCCATNLWIPKY